MNYEGFKQKYNGIQIDYDGYYGFQCMDLANQYNKEVVGAPRLSGDAKDVWNTYPKSNYDRISNTPTGVPVKGDMLIWGPMPGNPYGHIAVFDNGNVNTFQSFDQNWPVNSYCHLQGHSYDYLLGWLRPKLSLVNWDNKVDRMKTALNAGGTSENKAKEADKIFHS